MFSAELKNILIEYDPNAMRPDQEKIDPNPFIQSLNEAQKKSLMTEIDNLIRADDFSQNLISQYSGEEFESDGAAKKFMLRLNKYLFEKGDEPDISDYLAWYHHA